MRPYLEVKVVKARKKAQYLYFTTLKIEGRLFGFFHNKNGNVCMQEIKEKKGNWVNGENIDKIKFPCFCRWDDDNYGMIIKHYWDKEDVYILVGIEEQTQKNHTYARSNSLRDIINVYDIHIIKGKIILFEEE